MTSIQNYREALHNSASAYSATLTPKRAIMPLDYYEINLRSDAPAKAVSAGLANLTRLLQSKSRWDMGVKAGKRMTIYVPQRGPTPITVAPNTRVSLDIKVKNALPRVVIKFSNPVRLIRPSNDAGACVVNLLCDYQLTSITIHSNHAVDLDGYLATGIPGMRRHWPKRVVEPGAGSQAPQKHSMIRVAVAAAIAIMRNVPHEGVQAIAKNMASDAKRDDSGEILRLVESVLPLLTPGTVRGDSVMDAASKPTVVRCDRADVLIPAQKYTHHLNAQVIPTRKQVTVSIGEGTQLAADGLRLTMSGSMHYDGRNLTGRDVQAEVSQLSLIALVNNGTQNQMLFPVYIDTTRANNANTVARVATNFVFGEKMRLGGSVSFCLPAVIRDNDRRLQATNGSLVLDDANMQLVLQGNATMGNQSSDYNVNLRVRQLAAHGKVETKCEYADAAMPWSIEGCKDSPADPLSMNIEVQTQPQCSAADSPVVRRAGVTVRSAVPLRLGVPGRLHVEGSQGALDIHSAAMHVASTLAMGSHTRIPEDAGTLRNQLEGRVDLRLLQFAGTVKTDALKFEQFHLPQAALWQVGSGHVQGDGEDTVLGTMHANISIPQADAAPADAPAGATQPAAGSGPAAATPAKPWRCTGGASFHLPARFDGCPLPTSAVNGAPITEQRQRSAKLPQLALLAQGGPVALCDLGADITCEDAEFDITPTRRMFHLPVTAEYNARVSGHWQARMGLDTGHSAAWSVTPKPLVDHDAESDDSFVTAFEDALPEDALPADPLPQVEGAASLISAQAGD